MSARRCDASEIRQRSSGRTGKFADIPPLGIRGGGSKENAVHAQDYVAAIVFGLIIGVIARILLPGRQNIGIIFTVLVGMGAAIAGTWLAGRYDWHSTNVFVIAGRHFDWLVVAVQVVIAIIGVGLVSMLVRAFTTDRRVERR
jgi:uncharacterized membrane protein YeaQ/YmgE (transglycosylase-associated protein family)